ncbi:hypothetical protein PVAND_004154 [Polypedilum vanderplanki]|uniref:PRELI/MSF1 domain-containing protein n=1 Tax=Polypedilum vanderplanki TaxID=319348 RepID=A0A9J6BX99_POLVA|nr:hypothetical protein PVAND_004154 [Polypedilum vanderplanki]
MAKYYGDSTIFHYNLEQVLQGFWRRYPNPYSTHVLIEDTVEREVTKDGKLYSKRLLTKTNKLPKWGERFFKAKSVCIIEESLVDLKSKTLTTYTRNIGFNKIMSVIEKVVYRGDVHGNKTIAYRSAWIDSQVFGFASAIRAFGCERFKKNCQKTNIGFNYVLGLLYPMQNQHNSMQQDVAQKFKEAAKQVSEHVKEQIYEASHYNMNQN